MDFSGRFGLRSVTVLGLDFGGGLVVEFAMDTFVVEPRDPPAGGGVSEFLCNRS